MDVSLFEVMRFIPDLLRRCGVVIQQLLYAGNNWSFVPRVVLFVFICSFVVYVFRRFVLWST